MVKTKIEICWNIFFNYNSHKGSGVGVVSTKCYLWYSQLIWYHVLVDTYCCYYVFNMIHAEDPYVCSAGNHYFTYLVVENEMPFGEHDHYKMLLEQTLQEPFRDICYVYTQVPLCQIYCRTWKNVKNLKFVPILLCQRVKSFFFFSWALFFRNKSMNIGRTLLVFHMNEIEWTKLSKKIVRICRNQHARCDASLTVLNLLPNKDGKGELTRISTLQQTSSSICTVFWCLSITIMKEWPCIQLEQPEYSKND